MSKRAEIIDGRYVSSQKGGLIYTEVLGWVDLGHAQGMTSPFGVLRSGKMMTWRIRCGRPYWEQKSIALAIM